MSRYMSNEEAMNLFRSIDDLKNESNLSDDQLKRQVENIQNRIVTELSFLVYSVTKPYRSFPNYEDLVQEGFIGLVKAVRRFDHTRFPNFFVFSEQWIRHSVKRAASRFDVVYNPDKTRVVYAEPSEVSKEEEQVVDTPEEQFFTMERNERIAEVLGELPERDREIVKRIFGLDGYKPQTLREIGPLFDLTHERIRQIKNKAISKLRKNQLLNELSG